MDRLLVALLNTAVDRPDVLDTPLGMARWWLGQGTAEVESGTKPRYDAALCAWLRDTRSAIAAAASGGSEAVPLAFRGDGSDAIRFEVAYAARAILASGEIGRLRTCRRQACGRWFYDETKNGSRRWCSLRCMERARAPRRRTITR